MEVDKEGKMGRKKAETEEEKAMKEEEGVLPIETSPYLSYDNIEDYKLKGYGAQGHLLPVEGRGAGATDAPTPSGAAVPDASTPLGAAVQATHRSADATNRGAVVP